MVGAGTEQHNMIENTIKVCLSVSRRFRLVSKVICATNLVGFMCWGCWHPCQHYLTVPVCSCAPGKCSVGMSCPYESTVARLPLVGGLVNLHVNCETLGTVL